jgi:hypothetical protein
VYAFELTFLIQTTTVYISRIIFALQTYFRLKTSDFLTCSLSRQIEIFFRYVEAYLSARVHGSRVSLFFVLSGLQQVALFPCRVIIII